MLFRSCFKNVEDIVKSSQQPKYIYAYWPDFDRHSHDFGCNSSRVNAHFAELDEAFEKLLTAVDGTNTAVVVTADHGFIDTDSARVLQLSDHPVMQDSLVLPLCGEPRVAYCYVHPDKQQQFTDYVKTELADCAELKLSSTLVDEEYFGMGLAHPNLYERIGHYTLIMKKNYVFKDRLLGEQPFSHIGVHGGTSTNEMYVPLIFTHC